jgi:hypothetical protein
MLSGFILVTEEFAIVSGTVSLPQCLSSVPEQMTATGPTRVRLSHLASCHMSKKIDCLYVHMRLRGNRAMIAPNLGTTLSFLTVETSVRARLPESTARPRGAPLFISTLTH